MKVYIEEAPANNYHNEPHELIDEEDIKKVYDIKVANGKIYVFYA